MAKPKTNNAAKGQKRKNDAIDKEKKRESRKKAKKAALSHMQDIDERIKQRLLQHWKEALKDPLYKRALAKEKTYDAKLDDYQLLGEMNVKCEKGCGAVHFPNEKTRYCCCNSTGNGSFETLQKLDPLWDELLKDEHFRLNIRHYNCTFQIAMLGSSWNAAAPNKTRKDGIIVHSKEFPFYIRVHGQLFHSIPPAIRRQNEPARFLQLYIIDNALEEIMKVDGNEALDKEVVVQILDYLTKNNPWAGAIKRTVEKHMKNRPNVNNVVIDFMPGRNHQYRVPRQNIIAGFVPSASGKFNGLRQVYINNCNDDNKFTRINERNAIYDPAHYIIMFPKGDPGYSGFVSKGKNDSMLKFYQQRMQIRPGIHTSLCRFGRLAHEYVIDQWLKIESERLDYIKWNQKDFRGSSHPDERPDDELVKSDEGKSFVYLPPSFTGGKRYYRRKFLDGVSVANQVGAGTVLVTMTANPNWPEIQKALEPGETAQDRPDIVARVFYMKWNQLKNDVAKHHVLGFCLGIASVHEFQKNGMPHGHFIAILAKQDQPRTPEDVDLLVCAELPDVKKDPEGFALVTKHMLHGPCAENKCLGKDGKCSKQFPFQFQQSTTWEGEQRLKYRRRKDGRTFTGRTGFVFDNRYVVPYNMYLLKKYKCHLNVLVCNTKVASVRYLFGYINKGVDMATVKASLKNEDDEVDFFINGRYISAPEACHKLFGFETLNISPSIERLPVHLPGEKFCVRGKVGGARNVTVKDSQLEAFFRLNKQRMNAGETDKLYYTNISKYYIWQQIAHVWTPRQHLESGINGCKLNRMDNVLVKEGERYYLRLLLSRIANPTSFTDLRIMDGVEYDSFQDACRALGLLADDVTWHDTLKETEFCYPPSVVRSVFAQIIAFNEVNDPRTLWSDHVGYMAEDFRKRDDCKTVEPRHITEAVLDVEMKLNAMLTSLSNIAPLAFLLPENHSASDRRGKHVVKEHKYTKEEREAYFQMYQEIAEKTNLKQSEILQAGVAAILNITPKPGTKVEKLFLVNAAAGTGKTFSNNGLIYYMRFYTGTNLTCVCVSTTAISAQLLPDGHTAHSTFKLPIIIDDDGVVTCGIDFDSEAAKMFREAKMLIWDEAMSARKELVEAVDKFFRELFCCDEPFGGLIVFLSGDIRQTLPKIPRGSRGEIVASCINNSKLMSEFNTISLTENMRIHNCEHPDLDDPEILDKFEKFLLQLGDGSIEMDDDDRFVVPSFIHQSKTIEELIEFVYTKDIERLSDSELSERAILCPLNVDVQEVNNLVLEKLTGNVYEYFSTDTELDPMNNPIEELPPEVLHTLNRSGLPPHKLEVKQDSMVMCLRNMSVGTICNGTKMKVLNAKQHILECKILTGVAKGETVVLPRITLRDDSGSETVRFQRKQFPVRLAYGCSIDKSQGQSLMRAGILGRTNCFAHGQCYTAFSRPKGPEWLSVFQPDPHPEHGGETRMVNVVWPEVFPDDM